MNYLKKITASTVIFMLSFVAISQAHFGLKAGYGTGNVSLTSDDFEKVITGDYIQGFELGAFVDFRWDNVYLRPEALFMYRQGEVESTDRGNIQIQRLTIPIIFGVRLAGPLCIEGGPTYHNTIRFDSSYEQQLSIQKHGIGYRIGPSLQFGRLNIYANYAGNIVSMGSGSRLSEPYRINLGVGIGLGPY